MSNHQNRIVRFSKMSKFFRKPTNFKSSFMAKKVTKKFISKLKDKSHHKANYQKSPKQIDL